MGGFEIGLLCHKDGFRLCGLKCRRNHRDAVHSTDLQINGLRRLVVLAPNLVEYEGKAHSEYDT